MAKKGKTKRKTPSVLGFLSRVGGMPRSGDTPAKGLLGEISREDLVEAGRLQGEDAPSYDSFLTLDAELSQPVTSIAQPTPEEAAQRLERARAVGKSQARGDRDERKTERVPLELKVQFRSAGKVKVEFSTDISLGGAFVRTALPLEVGDPIMLSFEVPGAAAPLQLVARVKWVTPFGSVARPLPGMGVEFMGLDDEKREILRNLVQTPASPKPE